MSFKFAKQEEEGQQEEQQQGQNGKRQLEYSAGQFAFFDIGGVYNDPEGPIRHFTITFLTHRRFYYDKYKDQRYTLQKETFIVRGKYYNSQGKRS
ncbi:MAG TPA: hypothetical protein VJ799_02290 [Nitrososphaeraceae archaeon]|nr:hypothetical protein [Nitrososphaeraceae archaeon]